MCLMIAALLSGCSETPPSANPDNVKRYELRGRVVSVDRQAKRATIEHEEIPGFMDRMTMTFPIREDWVWDELSVGADIRAELVVDSTAPEPFWLEKIGIVAVRDPNAPLPEPKQPEQIGKPVPDIPLTNQDGKRFTFKDYRGKTLAVTFIYRECPLADYCIKMSRQFSDIAMQVAADPAYKDRIRLLSISFDSARDTPAKLREYGIGYLGNPAKPDFTVWQLAVGGESEVREIADFFGLKYEVDQNDKTQINHSLVTAVIGPDGRVKRIFSGNRWTNEELIGELKAAAG